MVTKRARTDSAKVARRRDIIRGAAGCLGARGLNAVSMQDIATACNLTKPALYSYFATREEIILAVYRTLLNDGMAAFNRSLLAAGHPLPRASFNSLFVSSFAERPLLCHLTNHLTATVAPKLTAATAEHLRTETAEQLAGLRALLLHYGYADADTADDLARAYYTILTGAAQIAAMPAGQSRTDMIDSTAFTANCLAALACLR